MSSRQAEGIQGVKFPVKIVRPVGGVTLYGGSHTYVRWNRYFNEHLLAEPLACAFGLYQPLRWEPLSWSVPLTKKNRPHLFR